MTNYGELVQAIEQAHQRIAPHLRRTPVELSPFLSAATGARVWCKLENYQRTGSFKLRGALNKVLSSSRAEQQRGFVAASTGNHGAAMAYAARLCDAPVTVFVPTTADPDKVERLRRDGVSVEIAGDDCTDAEAAARVFAADRGVTYVSPYNDLTVVAGQGTLGLELHEQLPDLDAVFIALGGGGLTGGVAAWLKSVRPKIQVVGCSPLNSAVMVRSIQAGRILDLPSLPTLSEGTAGGVEHQSITFEICRQFVDRLEMVPESAIADALRAFMTNHHAMIEGAAAVPMAAVLADGRSLAGQCVAVVVCGANIAMNTLHRILNHEDPLAD